jgi:hypothetical protein
MVLPAGQSVLSLKSEVGSVVLVVEKLLRAVLGKRTAVIGLLRTKIELTVKGEMK